jgi:acyl-CoA synthetase (AMP-forming)/AMP-acid ligase II
MQTFENSNIQPQFLNLGGLLYQASLKNPDDIALVCGEEQLSFKGLDQSTDALARWLLRAGLEPGHRVAIHWCNSIEVAQLYFACFKAGLIAVPLNNRLKAPEIAYILRHSRAKICFSQPALVDLISLHRKSKRRCIATPRFSRLVSSACLIQFMVKK